VIDAGVVPVNGVEKMKNLFLGKLGGD